MKLIYISDLRFPSEKIHSYFALKTCESFARKGVDVEMWIPRRSNKGFSEEDPFAYYHIEPIFTLRTLPVIDFVPYIPGRFAFLLLLVTFNISVAVRAFTNGLIKHALFYLHNPFDVVALSIFKPLMFLEVHELYEGMKNMSTLTRFLFSRMRGFITTNKFKANFLHDNCGIKKENIAHHQNVADVAQFDISTSRNDVREKLQLPKDIKIFLYTGQLFDWKGRDTLFETHSFLKNDECIYIVGGMKDDIEAFRSRCREKNIKNIILVGQRSHEEMPLWLRAADVLLVPHSGKFDIARFEASPVKLFEYMASGRPIVIADLPSFREVVDDSMIWWFEADNARSLVDVARSLLETPIKAEEKAHVSKRVVFERYTWEKRAGAILAFILQ